MMKFTLMFVFAVLIGAISAHAQPETLCQVSKNSRLAMDQRDEQRRECLKQKAAQINVDQCLAIAASFEYSNNAEDARLVCLYNLKKVKVTFAECRKIAASMEYPDSGDDVRWECLQRFNRKMTASQCQHIAKRMSYPANEERAGVFCQQ